MKIWLYAYYLVLSNMVLQNSARCKYHDTYLSVVLRVSKTEPPTLKMMVSLLIPACTTILLEFLSSLAPVTKAFRIPSDKSIDRNISIINYRYLILE